MFDFTLLSHITTNTMQVKTLTRLNCILKFMLRFFFAVNTTAALFYQASEDVLCTCDISLDTKMYGKGTILYYLSAMLQLI